MRSLRSGVIGITFATFAGFAAVVGCSASGDTGTTEATNEPEEAGPTIANPGDSSTEPAKDAATDSGKDGGKKEAGPPDAGPPPPEPGTPCTTVDEIRKKKCGKCGEASTACLPGDGGALSWGPYSSCENEVGECDPTSPAVTEACGNCGTQTKTCTPSCTYTTTVCGGQPMNSCTPGAVELVSASCTTPDTFRQRSCKEDCSWGNLSATCSAPPSYLLVPPAIGAYNTTIINLTASKTSLRLGGTCPAATISTTVTPSNYFEVRNTTGKNVKVSIYNTQAGAAGPIIDTVMAAYPGITPPANDAARIACLKGVNDFGLSELVGDSAFAAITGVSIAAGASVLVYTAAYYDASDPDSPTTGKINLNVKVEAFE